MFAIHIIAWANFGIVDIQDIGEHLAIQIIQPHEFTYNLYLNSIYITPLIFNTGPCPADKPLHYCFVPPCLTATCPAYPGAECVNNYCGGCNAEFYVDNKQKQVKCGELDLPDLYSRNNNIHYNLFHQKLHPSHFICYFTFEYQITRFWSSS
jgi:hypothetical protein